MGKRGKREFVQVLRLLETFRRDDVVAGIKEAMARGAIGFDAVKHLVLCRIERRPPRLDLTVYPYLPRATVATTSARTYMDLLTGMSSCEFSAAVSSRPFPQSKYPKRSRRVCRTFPDVL